MNWMCICFVLAFIIACIIYYCCCKREGGNGGGGGRAFGGFSDCGDVKVVVVDAHQNNISLFSHISFSANNELIVY
jgi:hypothetical protein